MKPASTIKKMFVTASVTFTVFVYLLYFFAFRITSDSVGEALSLRMLTGFFLFGALLGLTNAFLEAKSQTKLPKRPVHFAATLVNFVLTLLIVSGYAGMGQSANAPYNTATRVAVMLIVFVAIYWLCVGVRFLVSKLFEKGQKDKKDYTPVYKK